MKRTHLLGALIAVLVIPLISACGAQTQAPNAVAPHSRIDVIRLAGGQWGYPTPFLFKSGAGNALNSFVYDTLAWKDKDGKFIPLLATKWEPVSGGTAYRITLHQGVKWSDGQPFTADDVAFTFDYMSKGPGSNTGDAFGHSITSTQVVSPNVVILGTSSPGAFDELILGLIHILPKHVWQSVTDPIKFNQPEAFIGTGPYDLVSADPISGNYLFTARDSYFLGPPRVKRVEFVAAPDQALALQHGDIDMGTLAQGIPDQALAPFMNSSFKVVSSPGVAVTSLYFNISRGFPYNNTEFRQAIAYAIDRKEMVRRVLLGKGEVGSLGGLPPSDVWTAKDLPAYPYNVDKAKSLLDSAGLKLVNGARVLPDGSPYKPTILFGSTFNNSAADMVKEYLSAVGINVTFQTLDASSASAAQAAGRYEMSLLSTGPGVDPIDLIRMYSPKGAPVPGSWTVHGYSNPQYDDLWAKQNATADPTARMKIVREMEMITANDVAKIDLYAPYRILAYNTTKGVDWYWVPAGTLDGYGGILNKYILAVGK